MVRGPAVRLAADPGAVVVTPGEFRQLRASLDETNQAFRRAIEAMADAAAALADLTVALRPLELAARVEAIRGDE
jgi:hypothetical protein